MKKQLLMQYKIALAFAKAEKFTNSLLRPYGVQDQSRKEEAKLTGTTEAENNESGLWKCFT